ncbi:MAG TPA: LCP family protein [Clostridiales bacterium]|nr:LCP family protein [Clostridiales bacterium]
MKRRRILKYALMVLGAAVIVCGISGIVMVRTYIHKMNLVPGDAGSQTAGGMRNQRLEDGLTENGEAITGKAGDTGDTAPSRQSMGKPEEDAGQAMDEKNLEYAKDKEVYNVLVIGCDSRKALGSGRSDTMILISVNKNKRKVIMTSFLRDIYLGIPDHGDNRLNAAYAYGGEELLIRTIEDNFKVDIDNYVAVDFYAFIDAVDAIGGIELDISEEEIPIINEYIKEMNYLNGMEEGDGLLVEPGNYVLNGKQTLGYVRNRYIGTDFERTNRQRIVLQKVFEKVKKSSLAEIKTLLDEVLPQITTNISEGRIMSLLFALPVYKNYTMEPWSIPVEGSYSLVKIRRMDVIGIDFDKNREELKQRVYGK